MICITDKNLMDKLVEIEGESYRRHQPKYGYNAQSFIDAWNTFQVWLANDGEGCDPDLYEGYMESLHEEPVTSYDPGDPRSGNVAIYGMGGWTRYFVVHSTGEVVFSRRHAIPTILERAFLAGFRIV